MKFIKKIFKDFIRLFEYKNNKKEYNKIKKNEDISVIPINLPNNINIKLKITILTKINLRSINIFFNFLCLSN